MLPHGDDREAASQQHRRQHRGTAGTDHRNIQHRAKGGDAGITHRVDANSIEPLLLRRLANLEDADIGKHHISLADIIARRRFCRFEGETQLVAELDRIQLRAALGQVLLRHRKRNNHQNIFHRRPILCHAATSL